MKEALDITPIGADALGQADAAIAEAVLPIHHAPAIRFIGKMSDIADQPQMRVLCGSLIAWGMLAGNRRLARAGTRMLLAHEAATAVKSFVKHRVDRTRPRSLSDGEAPLIRSGGSRDKEKTSFPSGHSAGAAATARAFAREFPEHSAAVYAGAGLVALAQIPRCAHYPTDVGAGLALGVAAEAFVHTLFPARLDARL
jgi:membrane-associated phospholipid phosphatase